MLGFEEVGSAQAIIAKPQCKVLSLPLNVSIFRSFSIIIRNFFNK